VTNSLAVMLATTPTTIIAGLIPPLKDQSSALWAQRIVPATASPHVDTHASTVKYSRSRITRALLLALEVSLLADRVATTLLPIVALAENPQTPHIVLTSARHT